MSVRSRLNHSLPIHLPTHPLTQPPTHPYPTLAPAQGVVRKRGRYLGGVPAVGWVQVSKDKSQLNFQGESVASGVGGLGLVVVLLCCGRVVVVVVVGVCAGDQDESQLKFQGGVGGEGGGGAGATLIGWGVVSVAGLGACSAGWGRFWAWDL